MWQLILIIISYLAFMILMEILLATEKGKFEKRKFWYLLAALPLLLYLALNKFFAFSYYLLIPFLIIIIYYVLSYKKKGWRFSRGYITTKFFDIIFQQAFIIMVWYFLLQYSNPILWFVLIFGGLHFPMLLKKNRMKMMPYIIMSWPGALTFALLLYYFETGYYLTFAVHLSFYMALAFIRPNYLKNES